MWYFGLFFYSGVLIKALFDYFDRGLNTDPRTPEGKKTVGSWLIGFVVASLCFTIQFITGLTDNAGDNDFSLAAFLFCYSFIGYLAPHLYLKGASWFDKKSDKALENK